MYFDVSSGAAANAFAKLVMPSLYVDIAAANPLTCSSRPSIPTDVTVDILVIIYVVILHMPVPIILITASSSVAPIFLNTFHVDLYIESMFSTASLYLSYEETILSNVAASIVYLFAVINAFGIACNICVRYEDIK